LKELAISFPQGLTVVFGEVGSGKSALMQALLGELDQLSGKYMRSEEPIGYCAQSPWLQSMSIRDNILFGSPYEDERYKAVLHACALTPDLAEFRAGDLSLIGENGIGLSGGQRARVALARALYSKARILLLDDPLSALDQQTAEFIVDNCLRTTTFTEGRTIVLATHRTDLVIKLARRVIEMEDGRALTLDHMSGVPEAMKYPPYAKGGMMTTQAESQLAAAVPEKFIEDEHRQQGGVKASVYWEYVKAGKISIWMLLIVVLAFYRLVSVAEAWFLKTWGEAYNGDTMANIFTYTDDIVGTKSTFLDDLPRPDVNIKPWLLGFFLLGLGKSLCFIFARVVMIIIIYLAAKNMFIAIMDRVAGATFRFYDVTPIGRLMNRMTSDISVIDGNISMQFQSVAWLTLSWIGSIIVIGSVTPTFLVFSALLTIAFVLIFMRFIPTSQSLRRLEMVSLTPLMSNFGALLNGLTTVRAFRVQRQFQDRVVQVVDTFQKMDHFYWSLQAWLMYRYDTLSAFSFFLITMLALATNVSAGLTAFVLIAANKLVTSTHQLCKQYGQLQMDFVSVERIVELLHLEQEPKGTVLPPAWWPSFSSDIVFDAVAIRYAAHMDPALAGVSFTIKGGSKTAIIGRTGSGKSTLALSILATLVPEAGQILVDKIDLAEVDKHLLRTRVTFLAQDPVLFVGTMRKNLDPVNDHTDEACESVLKRVCAKQEWELDTKIEAGGRNLSQGQRQLVGLARAVLRRSAIIILDEATASIDHETAMQIQQVMHEEMKDSTVITIAHRLEAVRNADYCIELGHGKVIREGTAVDISRWPEVQPKP
jgi:ABC-type multidrug transport system fused ATPase/permease subunit